MREPTRVLNLGGSATQATVNAIDLHLPGAVTRVHRFTPVMIWLFLWCSSMF